MTRYVFRLIKNERLGITVITHASDIFDVGLKDGRKWLHDDFKVHICQESRWIEVAWKMSLFGRSRKWRYNDIP